MLTNFLLKSVINENEDYMDKDVRGKVGYLAGIVGIASNLLLFGLKLTVGFVVSSIAITADAFNNLSDASSSVITILGFKLGKMPADKEHPYGHGRIEYISAMLVAFMVMLVGFQFIKSSFNRIMNPEPVVFEWIPFLLLFISIFLKVWLSYFNKLLGEKIHSSALKATAADALGDVLITSVVVISFLASKFFKFPIDGYIGMLVAAFIVYAGFNLVRETINPLIGEAPDPEVVAAITTKVLSYDYITGVHDLIVHNYGPGRSMASIHAEIPSDISVVTIHEIIDAAEREISDELGIHLVIHMDPISVDDEEIYQDRLMVEDILKDFPVILSYHDLRIVGEGVDKTLLFDIVAHNSDIHKLEAEEALIAAVKQKILDRQPQYKCIIHLDLAF